MFGIFNTYKKKTVTGTAILAVFLSVFFFSLFSMSSGMSVVDGEPGCALMPYQETVCSMNILDHLGLWQGAFLLMSPSVALLLLLLSSVFIGSVAPNLLFSKNFLYRYVRRLHKIKQVKSYPVRPFQDLFSQGILHPKLF